MSQVINETDIKLFKQLEVRLKNNYNIVEKVESWQQVVAMLILSIERALSSWIMWSNISKIVGLIV